VTAKGLPRERAEPLVRKAIEKLRTKVAAYVYGEDEVDLAAVVLDKCRSLGITLAVAESCTGGMLGERLTNVPGSSDVFLGGVIAYHNDVKRDSLGVRADDIERYGAVSEQVALLMAAGVRERLKAKIGVSITGVAGPGGGSPEKPVGLVWVAVQYADGRTRRLHLPGDRNEIRQRATQAALEMVRRTLSSA
jgi:nicotinamide-nucleotide amidase